LLFRFSRERNSAFSLRNSVFSARRAAFSDSKASTLDSRAVTKAFNADMSFDTSMRNL
jgi:hypothetical protein